MTKNKKSSLFLKSKKLDYLEKETETKKQIGKCQSLCFAHLMCVSLFLFTYSIYTFSNTNSTIIPKTLISLFLSALMNALFSLSSLSR